MSTSDSSIIQHEDSSTMSKSDSNPIIIQHEGSSFNAGIVFNETNYELWSQMLEMQIAEKEKLSFIRDTSTVPKEKEDGYEKWYSDNQKVKRWLLMSMSPEIMKRYIRLPTARDIWKALSKAFYDGADELQVFTLNQRAFSAKQNGRSLSIYYGELTEIFGELDHRDKVVMVNEKDIASYQKSLQRQRVHIFLAGLDDNFEQVRGEILRKDPIPDLEECYALVRREDVQRGVMNGQLENTEASAMVIQNRSNQNWSSQYQQDKRKNIHPKNANGGDKSSYKCTHYDDHKKLLALAAAATGNDDNFLNISTPVSNSAWITDSGATEHMTFDSRQISPINTSSQKSVTTANGNSISIIGEGSLSLTNTLNLDSILDIRTKQTIGCGVRRGKLYYIDLVPKNLDNLGRALTIDGSKEKSEISLWHRRLGHASFGYIKKLFPSLFVNFDVSSFKCEVCELAKSHRTSFPLNLNKSPVPFMIIHSDVWGPSKFPTLDGSRWFVTFIDDCTRMTWVLRSDNEGEYLSFEVKQYLEAHGITHQTTCPYTPQQIGWRNGKIITYWRLFVLH
ncbi:uncharacterized protein LOC141691962 [Apium graveolens]|uniref:uncharacterized protein LOC141691962 n=1 Tax=Apium graveolens TaxID=4045 RepID=UPI003D7A61BE